MPAIVHTLTRCGWALSKIEKKNPPCYRREGGEETGVAIVKADIVVCISNRCFIRKTIQLLFDGSLAMLDL